MAVQKFVTRVLIPCGSAVLIPPLMPLLHADEDVHVHGHGEKYYHPHDANPNIFEGLDSYPNQTDSTFMSPQDLPIYDKTETEGVTGDEYELFERGSASEKIQQGVTKVRRAVVTNVVDNMNIENNREKLRGNVDNGINRIRRAYDYISREENYVARAAAITSGGLIGLFLARRGGMIKKIFYTSIGITGVASAVYPKEAALISEDLFKIGKYYAIVAYQKMQESAGTTETVNAETDDTKDTKDDFDQMAERASDVQYWGYRLDHSKPNLEGENIPVASELLPKSDE